MSQGQDKAHTDFGQEKSNYLMVAAIDFGTTYTGWATSIKAKPYDIFVYKDWGLNSAIFHSYKTPSCVLTDKDLKFVAIGFEAQTRYIGMLPEEIKEHRFFRGFKMKLHTAKNLDRMAKIEDTEKKPCSAMTIFAMVLREMKRHLLDTLKSRKLKIDNIQDNKYIRWVVTVPAIWSDAAKQFMREAAVEAGLANDIKDTNLIIALEPEAASLYCTQLKNEGFSDVGGAKTVLKAGDKYVVVDAGGGTLDITVHELHDSGQVTELHHANGGPIGASEVNANFMKMLDDIVEKKFIEFAKVEHPHSLMSIQHAFEITKRAFDPTVIKHFAVMIDCGFTKLYNDIHAQHFEKSLTKTALDAGVRIANGQLHLPHEYMMKLFTPVVNEIITYIGNLLKQPQLKDVSKILMVGGFSDCRVLQQAMEKEFGDRSICMVPQEAWSAVLKGAVLFGHDAALIKTRISKLTYGIELRPYYKPGEHDENRVVVIDGMKRVENVFEPWIRRGQKVEISSKFTKIYHPSKEDSQGMGIHLFSTDAFDPKYTDEQGMNRIGHLSIPMQGLGFNRSITVTLKFGGTHIEVEAHDNTTKKPVSTTIDFLTE